MPQNPYIERGIVPTPREWEILQEALGGQQRFFAAQEMTDDAALVVDMLRRYGQVVNAGTGLTDDVLERYQKRIFLALRKGDMPEFNKAYGDMFATAIRLSPDPAEHVGRMLVQVAHQIQAARALEMCAGPFFGRVKHEIECCRKDVADGTWDPDKDVLVFLEAWLQVGFNNAIRGLEPWPEVEPVTEPEDPAAAEMPKGEPAP